MTNKSSTKYNIGENKKNNNITNESTKKIKESFSKSDVNKLLGSDMQSLFDGREGEIKNVLQIEDAKSKKIEPYSDVVEKIFSMDDGIKALITGGKTLEAMYVIVGTYYIYAIINACLGHIKLIDYFPLVICVIITFFLMVISFLFAIFILHHGIKIFERLRGYLFEKQDTNSSKKTLKSLFYEIIYSNFLIIFLIILILLVTLLIFFDP